MWVEGREGGGGAREEGGGGTEEVDWEEGGGKAEKTCNAMRYWEKGAPEKSKDKSRNK